ncbi:DUF418 domain-containing protein [Aneurinibacillus migulanus]|uniref:DUF418 domain-containing protein n=1 Tax=Aneurinibacillus migulanus TaxID=47500 RepID=UPI00069716B1|nr:DUF418 domain-containing protein [Aneurinibacillus migulanus]CEH29205.1 Uncharacterized protein BN1090_A2_01631 [Aneurinibacillus migulanus]
MDLKSIYKDERNTSIDIIRGVALFGILLVNMPSFDRNHFGASYLGIDAFIRLLYDLFIQQKFYPIFSFLFGLGFYIFMSRAEYRGQQNIYFLFTRRLLVLLLFGIIHQMMWQGDILKEYAIYGFILIPFYRRRTRTILLFAFVLTLVYLIMMNKIDIGIHFDPMFSMPILIMLLLGVYAGKKQILINISNNLNLIYSIQIVSFVISIPALYAILGEFLFRPEDSFAFVDSEIVAFSAIPLSIFYISTFILLLERKFFLRILRPIGYVGRMSLTNYLLQTLIGLTLVKIFKMNLNISMIKDLFLAVIIYGVQIGLSFLWIRKFQYGPLEKLLRFLTYSPMLGAATRKNRRQTISSVEPINNKQTKNNKV